MSLKEQVEAMRSVLGKKACHHGYNLTNVVSTLYAYIAELEGKADAPAKKATPKTATLKKATAKKATPKKTAKK
jgi:topoisomerase IA-like protein